MQIRTRTVIYYFYLDGTYDPNAYWTAEQYANYQWPANYYQAPTAPQGYNPATAIAANTAAKANKNITPAVKQKGYGIYINIIRLYAIWQEMKVVRDPPLHAI